MFLFYIVFSTHHLVIKASILSILYLRHRLHYCTSLLLLLVMTDYCKFRGFNNTGMLPHKSVGWKSEHGIAGFSAQQDEMKVLARAMNAFKTCGLCPRWLVVGRI